MLPNSTSEPCFELIGSKNTTEGFNHKAHKFRSVSKANLCSPRSLEPFSQSCDIYSNVSHKDEIKKEDFGTSEPVKLRELSVDRLKQRMKAKPTHSLELNIFHRYRVKSSTRIPVSNSKTDPLSTTKSGFLLFKQKGKKPKRRWVALGETHLRCYRGAIDNENTHAPVAEIPLEYASVKKKDETTFVVITNVASYIFQAEEATVASKWVSELSTFCEKLIANSINYGNIYGQHNRADENSEISWMASASKCADCGDTNPGWTSVNLGIFICMECAGVHRSFGTHISHVKAVYLDQWTYQQIQDMKEKGNEKSNNIWEYQVPQSVDKITSRSTRGERVKWLTDKYVIGKFRSDYIDTGPTKFSGKQSAKEDMRNIILENLRDDDSFRKNIANLIFGFV